MLLEQLKKIVGPNGLTTDPHAMAPSLKDWRGAVEGSALAVVSPASTAEVAAVVKACADAKVAIVPQGGNTGLCGGATPDKSGKQIVLQLGRMNAIRSIDPENFSIEVEAGCILENVQRAARDAGRLFALSLGAEGSCQIGGNLSTNAGGINVIRYGTARAQVLGLEAVLADGSVVSSLRSLRKDTAGYDLKQLFIGSEGTLGIITAATLRLFPDPGTKTTALIALGSSGEAVRLLSQLRGSVGDTIEAFELISGFVQSNSKPRGSSGTHGMCWPMWLAMPTALNRYWNALLRTTLSTTPSSPRTRQNRRHFGACGTRLPRPSDRPAER